VRSLDELQIALAHSVRRLAPLDDSHRSLLHEHVSLFAAALRVEVSRHDEAMLALDVLCNAGTESVDGQRAMDLVASTDGFVCLPGRATAICAFAACYGWSTVPRLHGMQNPWISYVELVLAGVYLTYEIDESGITQSIGLRASTAVDDLHLPVGTFVSAGPGVQPGD